MSWSPLERDLLKLARAAASTLDFTADADNRIRATGQSGGRERILALRAMIQAGLEDRESLHILADEAAILEHDQRLAAERLARHAELAAVAEAFTAVADELQAMVDLAEGGQSGLLLGSLANVESRIEELEAQLQSLP